MTIRQLAIAVTEARSRTGHSTAAEIEEAHQRCHRQMAAAGLYTEGMCLNCYGDHKNDPVDLPDSVVQQVKDLALTSAKDHYGWNDTPYFSNFVRSYIPTVKEVDKRLATSTALQKVWRDEVDRIGWYIHSKNPNWTNWGQHFDLSILDDYRQGIDVKV